MEDFFIFFQRIIPKTRYDCLLHIFGVTRIVLNTSQTPTIESMENRLNLMGCEKFMGVAKNHHAMENSHVFIVHIFQYLLITLSGSEMIVIIRRSITLM
jgi:hypothetical protein